MSFSGLALALLVARVVTDDHDPAVAPDDPALVADLLDARLDLHRYALLARAPAAGTRRRMDARTGTGAEDGWIDRSVTCSGRRCAHGSGRTARARRRPGPRA